MVASIGVLALPSQGVAYYEKDGYYTVDDPAHREASAWAGRGAEDLGLPGPVDPERAKWSTAKHQLGTNSFPAHAHGRPSMTMTQ